MSDRGQWNANGIGAFNEAFEFVATFNLGGTAVGGVDNTGFDLIFDIGGAIASATYLIVRHRRGDTDQGRAGWRCRPRSFSICSPSVASTARSTARWSSASDAGVRAPTADEFSPG